VGLTLFFLAGIFRRIKSALDRLIKWVAKGARNHPVCDT
jgi:hypothetical protein